MSHEFVDCNTHEMVGGFAISYDTVAPSLRILTSPWDARNILPSKLFTTAIKTDGEKNPWSSVHLTNREVVGTAVVTHASRDINAELFKHPFTPQLAVFEVYPAPEGEQAHWHLKISPFMDKKTLEEIDLFLDQFDDGRMKDSIGRDIAEGLPVCELGEGEPLCYRSESLEIELDDQAAVLRYGLKPALGWESESDLRPLLENPYTGYDRYETSIGIEDAFYLLSDMPVPAWEVLYGVKINKICEDIYHALDQLRQKKDGFTISEIYQYIQPYITIRRKKEGGVE